MLSGFTVSKFVKVELLLGWVSILCFHILIVDSETLNVFQSFSTFFSMPAVAALSVTSSALGIGNFR
jgi:hypothetical protein